MHEREEIRRKFSSSAIGHLVNGCVYVGEVMVAGMIEGTSWARDGQGIESAAVANKFSELYQACSEIRARVSRPVSDSGPGNSTSGDRFTPCKP